MKEKDFHNLNLVVEFLNLIFILIILIGLFSNTFTHTNKDLTKLEITQEEEKKIMPDQVNIVFSTITEDKDPQKALDENTKINNNLVEAFSNDYKVETTRFNIHRIERWNGSKKDVFYRVTNTIHIKTDRINETGNIIDKGLQLGANQVENVYFSLSDDLIEGIKKELLEKAIIDSKAKAENIARELGLKISKILDIRPNDIYFPVYDGYYRMASGSSPMIEPQEQKVSLSVSTTYLLK